jgi:hypothetical protein
LSFFFAISLPQFFYRITAGITCPMNYTPLNEVLRKDFMSSLGIVKVRGVRGDVFGAYAPKTSPQILAAEETPQVPFHAMGTNIVAIAG